MDQTLKYANTLTEVLRAKAALEFSTIPRLKMVASCDAESGQFLLILIGWDNRERWHHSITFHAQLINNKIVIECDMTEGLKDLLLEAGIPEEAFLSDRERDRQEAALIAA